MSDTTSADTPSEFPGLKSATRLGIGLLVVLAVVVAVSVRDNSNRSQLEKVREFSAVGDTLYAKMPTETPESLATPVVTLDGQPLYLASFRKREKRDADLIPVARDPATGVNIYQTALKAKDESNKDEGQVYFVKVGPGEFLKIHTQPPAPPDAPAQ